jgi:hypothetical protein
MKTYIIITAALLTLISCKKDKIETPTIEENKFESYSPNTKGSYWIYDWVEVDTNGVETPLPYKDTLRIIGDTMIKNNTYTIKRGTSKGGPVRNFYSRDSSGYIVGVLGGPSSSYINFSDTINSYESPGYLDIRIKMFNNIQVSIPLGTFATIEARRFHYNPNGGSINNNGDLYFTYSSWFADGIGRVKSSTGYFSETIQNGTIMEQRLVEYYIAP